MAVLVRHRLGSSQVRSFNELNSNTFVICKFRPLDLVCCAAVLSLLHVLRSKSSCRVLLRIQKHTWSKDLKEILESYRLSNGWILWLLEKKKKKQSWGQRAKLHVFFLILWWASLQWTDAILGVHLAIRGPLSHALPEVNIDGPPLPHPVQWQIGPFHIIALVAHRLSTICTRVDRLLGVTKGVPKLYMYPTLIACSFRLLRRAEARPGCSWGSSSPRHVWWNWRNVMAA